MLIVIIPIASIMMLFFSKEEPEESSFENLELATISKNKSRYLPGDSAQFHAHLTQKPNQPITYIISYFHLGQKIDEQSIHVTSQEFDWSWQTPEKDYQGYYVKVSRINHRNQEKTIAVDVSSTWTKFPRYGFLSDFSNIDRKHQEEIVGKLSRYHINGIQFYDWQDEHHLPLKMDGNKPLSSWANIANQPVDFQTIENYIDLAHSKNINAMSYNLLNGSLAGAENENVNQEWYVYTDPNQDQVDNHQLPDQWKSDIYLMNPGHSQWQDYIMEQQKRVFEHLDFDGWHLDQLGDRGDVFDSEGQRIKLKEAYPGFLNHASGQFMDKSLIMNAVNQYGQKQIADSLVPFLYTEVWDPYKTYQDLQQILKENHQTFEKPSVLAAYMNYKMSDQEGGFNGPGILYTDALIFAQGGGHLELGEHMLSKEYFPHNKLDMSEDLQDSLIAYYDYMVAYQNLLRDRVQETELEIKSSDWVQLSSQPEKGKIYAFAKQRADKKMIHFLNYMDVEHMNWRDTNGTQNSAVMRETLSVTIQESKQVKKVWVSSPDWNEGMAETIDFSQEGDHLQFTIPKIKYWDMVVLEY
ncbi:glycoside hydrolase family 66 protein [Halobacillus seohaensis]|uniref:Glycoside hydrolase family 66 protein n=1 Tax=Halobacillus seohaensis TaxID=447421 RepID=A0ABW2EP57_9BACI